MTPKYKIEVETIKYGQAKKYADSEYEFIITTDYPYDAKEFIKKFCLEVLYPCRQTDEEKEKALKMNDDTTSYFSNSYKFEELEKNKFRYYVFQPDNN